MNEMPEKVPGFRGMVDKILLDRKNRIYIWSQETRSITVLELQQKILDMEYSGLPQGVYLSNSIDSTISEMRWHKLTLEAEVPENTQIKISYFSSDRKVFMIKGKILDLDKFIKDEAVSPEEKIGTLKAFYTGQIVNPSDALFHGATGRYLWLKIEFIGSDCDTPILKKIRIYYPRTSYLRYLPDIYQEDAKSNDFLERFLSLFESLFMDMEEKIGKVSHPDNVGPNGTKEFNKVGVDGFFFAFISWFSGSHPSAIRFDPKLFHHS